MTTERNNPTTTAINGTDARTGAEPTVEDVTQKAASGHDSVVRLGFRERPYYDEMLMKTHPSKVFFDAFHLHPTADGYVPVLISSVLVDKSIRH